MEPTDDTSTPPTQPEVRAVVRVYDLRAEHLEVAAAAGHVWLDLGPHVTVFAATTDDLIAIGNEIVRQAAALDVAQRVDGAVAENEAGQ